MKTVIELDAKDMAEIIAKHFSVSVKDVDVDVEEITMGYGMGEHQKYVPVCTVRRDMIETKNEAPQKRKYYRKCGVCGGRHEQSDMIRDNGSPNGWICHDCHNIQQPECDADAF